MRKSERLLNLLIMLLVARRHLDKQQIRGRLYPDQGDEAFERMFERDKEELRQLGVPIETGSQDVFFDDDPGYRIHRRAYELPEVELAPDEAAVIGLAARVWQHAGLAAATSEAIGKLRAAGVAVDRSALDLAEPQLRADEPAFDVCWEAVQLRAPLEFDYRRGGGDQVGRRHLQPWRVVWGSGRWYVLGLDTDRGEPRVFRLSRISGEVRSGPPGAFEVPADVDLDALTRSLTGPPEPAEPATVLVRQGAGRGLRRRATRIEASVAGPDGSREWDRLVIEAASSTLADDVLAFGRDAYAESPPALRDAVVRRLQGVVR